jgi:hypothetical protein
MSALPKAATAAPDKPVKREPLKSRPTTGVTFERALEDTEQRYANTLKYLGR